MHRFAFRLVGVLLCLLSLPVVAQDLVSRPRAGEQETAQAGGGSGRFSFIGALRCPDGRVMVGLRTSSGPLLNGVELACAPPICDSGQCRWRADSAAWLAAAGTTAGEATTMLCPTTAMVSGFRATVVRVPSGTAVDQLQVQCAALAGIAPDGGFAIVPGADPRGSRTVLPPGRPLTDPVRGSCRDRGAAAVSVAVGTYPPGLGGQGLHVRALSVFCGGQVE
ncbi:hypothetical protein [Elioraea sp.]|uniref:hypothetical protein n=1 Tax=Elioraea sp. TaxID=2185103 RepID=UPI0025C1D680|nr:hypothetical protein [Elioraea sp.]